MTALSFEIATLKDMDDLIALRVLMQKEVHAIPAEVVDLKYEDLLRSYFTQKIASGEYLSAIAKCDGRVVSANGLIVYQKPPSITGGSGLVGYVSNVYTLPEWRRRGIACKLMQLLLDHASTLGVSKLHLGATEDGQGIYERLGFKSPKYAPLEFSYNRM